MFRKISAALAVLVAAVMVIGEVSYAQVGLAVAGARRAKKRLEEQQQQQQAKAGQAPVSEGVVDSNTGKLVESPDAVVNEAVAEGDKYDPNDIDY